MRICSSSSVGQADDARPVVVYAVDCYRGYAEESENDDADGSHKDVLFQNFPQQLCLHYAERYDIGFYAQSLRVSVRYLQKVVKDITGRTVYSYISERLRIYARRLLASSDMTIEQIAFR